MNQSWYPALLNDWICPYRLFGDVVRVIPDHIVYDHVVSIYYQGPFSTYIYPDRVVTELIFHDNIVADHIARNNVFSNYTVCDLEVPDYIAPDRVVSGHILPDYVARTI